MSNHLRINRNTQNDSAYNNQCEELGLKSVVSKWVPYSLNEQQLDARVVGCNILMETLQRMGMRQRTYVIDEKWINVQSFPPQTSW